MKFKSRRFKKEIKRDVKKEITKRGGRVTVKFGFRVLTDSKRNVRVDTGRLRASGKIDISNKNLKVTISYPIEYASFEHDGTRFMSGSFHLLRSIDKHRSAYLNELKTAINQRR